MRSIRTKLYLAFSLLLIFFVLFSIFMNIYFLEKYYILRNESNFVKSLEVVKDVYDNDPNNIHEAIKEIDRSTGLHISIFSSDMVIKSDSFPFPEDKIKPKKVSKETIDMIKNNQNKLKNGYLYEIDIDERYSAKNLQLISRIGEDNYIILSKPLVIINESAKIANDFFAFVGIITIILGNIFIFLFSKRMVKPIVEISSIAKEISSLDFKRKYKSNLKDEIGVLGESINLISDKLDTTIQELVEANEVLKDDIKEKQQIDNMRKTFISNVSHELKTPIALIKGYLEGFKYGVVSDESQKEEYLDIIIDETDKMNKLVKELLELSTIESRVELEDKTVFNISVLIDDISEKYKPIFLEKQIEYSVICDDDYFVKANIFRIEQVLSNYINNALNHVDDSRRLSLVVNSLDENVKISVENTGDHIDDHELKNIWTSFYKIDKSRSREYGGSGLGLSIVKAIIDDHNGQCGVINTNSGVKFWIELAMIIIN